MLAITDPRITETINSSDFQHDFAEAEKANYEEHKARYADNRPSAPLGILTILANHQTTKD